MRLYDFLPSGNGYKAKLPTRPGFLLERVASQPGHVPITFPAGPPT